MTKKKKIVNTYLAFCFFSNDGVLTIDGVLPNSNIYLSRLYYDFALIFCDSTSCNSSSMNM